MASQNPKIYYENKSNHGNYQYVFFEDLVNNFMLNYTGDGTTLGGVKRYNVVYNVKQAIRKFNYTTLGRIKRVELNLGDTLDVIFPPDYVNYVRVSSVNEDTGELMLISQNKFSALGISYLQDNQSEMLFDNKGEVLIGTTLLEDILDKSTPNSTKSFNQNCNGFFNITDKRMHFSSDNAPKTILLEYISDGIEVEESEIKIHKLAEEALYAEVNYKMVQNNIKVQDYEKRNIKRERDIVVHNAKVKLLNIKPQEFLFNIKQAQSGRF